MTIKIIHFVDLWLYLTVALPYMHAATCCEHKHHLPTFQGVICWNGSAESVKHMEAILHQVSSRKDSSQQLKELWVVHIDQSNLGLHRQQNKHVFNNVRRIALLGATDAILMMEMKPLP